jgi:TPR repeat protein
MYFKGEGVAKDAAVAMAWYRKAADQGYENAQCTLGRMYFQGKGVVQDSATTVAWIWKSAPQGHATAQDNIAKGEGLAKYLATAALWYPKAAARGNDVAQCNLGEMYAIGGDVVWDERSRGGQWRSIVRRWSRDTQMPIITSLTHTRMEKAWRRIQPQQ